MARHYFLIVLFTIMCATLCVLSSGAAEKRIAEVQDVAINYGQTYTVQGSKKSIPDIYFTSLRDGSWKVTRLTVYPAALPASVTVPYLNNCTPTSIHINWKSVRHDLGAVVKFGTSPSALTRKCEASAKILTNNYCWNTARLTGLAPATTYYYTITCDGHTSPLAYFRTMPERGSIEPIRVLLAGDHQRNTTSDYEWLINAARRKIDQKYGTAGTSGFVHLLMNVGDQVDKGIIEQYEDIHLFKSRFTSPYWPTMTAVGNHEYNKDPYLANYNSHFSSYGEIEYQGIRSNTSEYYTYQAGSVLFIVFNSRETSDRQKEWAQKVMKAADSDDSVIFIVSVQHAPLYAEQYPSDIAGWVKEEILPIVSASPKHILNCSGHHHLYARGQLTETPAYHVISGGGVGSDDPTYEQLWHENTPAVDLGEVQKTIDQWTYTLLEFDPVTKTMTAETYSIGNSRLVLNNSMIDKFSRCLADTSIPKAPELRMERPREKGTFRFRRAGTMSDIHSTQYQISTDPMFNTIVTDTIVTVENIFGIDNHFLPIDINKESDLSEFIVRQRLDPEKMYYLRARDRNNNLMWSDFSLSVEFGPGRHIRPVSESHITLGDNFSTEEPIYVYKSDGTFLSEKDEYSINSFICGLPQGVYIVSVPLNDGTRTACKIIR